MFLGLKVYGYILFHFPINSRLCMVQLSFVLFYVAMVTMEPRDDTEET